MLSRHKTLIILWLLSIAMSVVGMPIGGATTAGTNSVIAQTGHNFEGFGQVEWGQVGINATVGGVAGFAGGAAGYGAANMGFLVNGVNSPALRSAVVSPLAAGAGHVAGGTAANLFAGQNLGGAFVNSFDGIGQSMAVGGTLGVASTIGVSYASGVNPWTGKLLTPKYIDLNKPRTYDFSPDPYGDNVSLYRGITGSENRSGPLFMTDNPEYAASYVANGGKVVKVTIPRSTLVQMYHEGLLNYYTGIHIKGSNYLEYMFEPDIKPTIISKFKY